MAKLNISSLFVMALLASPSFALFFGSEPRGFEDMDAREFDLMFRRDVQAHHDIWVEVDQKLRVIDLPWYGFLANTFLTRYREFALKQYKKAGTVAAGTVSPHPSTPAGPSSSPAGGNTAPVSMPIPIIPVPPIIPDTNADQNTLAARDYIEDLIERTLATFSGNELDARGFTDSDEDFFAREPQPQYTDELYERGFDGDEVYERGFDDYELAEREFGDDELYVRGFDDELYERGYEDDTFERSFEDEVDAREVGDGFDEVFARDYFFDDLD